MSVREERSPGDPSVAGVTRDGASHSPSDQEIDRPIAGRLTPEQLRAANNVLNHARGLKASFIVTVDEAS